MSENETESGAAWEAIAGGHAMVAVDYAWALTHHLPQTAEHVFSDQPGQVVYGIEAYHAMHCLVSRFAPFPLPLPSPSKPLFTLIPSAHQCPPQKTIRRHYFNLKNNETPDRPLEHDLHCFDALRQSIMCAADDTLLAYTAPFQLGVNQVRRCRDWDALRDWAVDHTACYRDWEPPEGESRWGHCDGVGDGLPRGSLLW